MKADDLKRYELSREQHHENLHRTIATYAELPHILCRVRKCRRDGNCVGPMIESRHMEGSVRAQQALGMSGNACSRLPACIADASDEHYAVYRACVEKMPDGVVS